MKVVAKPAPSYTLTEGANVAKFVSQTDNDVQFLGALYRLFEYGGKALIEDMSGMIIEYTISHAPVED